MTIDDKVDILIRDFGLARILEQNDLTEEEVLTELIGWGLIDLDEYFYKDQLIINED